MNLKQLYLLITVTAAPGMTNAFPTKIIVKNETETTQLVMAFARYTTPSMSDEQGSGYVNDINAGEEIDITSRLFADNIGTDTKLTIQSLTLQINNQTVSLGNATDVLVIIGQKDGNIIITIEPKT